MFGKIKLSPEELRKPFSKVISEALELGSEPGSPEWLGLVVTATIKGGEKHIINAPDEDSALEQLLEWYPPLPEKAERVVAKPASAADKPTGDK